MKRIKVRRANPITNLRIPNYTICWLACHTLWVSMCAHINNHLFLTDYKHITRRQAFSLNWYDCLPRSDISQKAVGINTIDELPDC